ncbi:MAG: mechanosensitive ion channel family protein [Vulcanococcus sp.]
MTALLAAQLISGGTLQAQAQEEPAGRPEVGMPFDRQPFHAALLETAERWRDAPLGQVVGDSPRDTLLNFYAVMARVDQEIQAVSREAPADPGWFWSEAERQRIATAESLFQRAVEALDASAFPESIRDDRAQEAAIQLKQVLDYVFSHSDRPISIPDAADLKTLNSQRNRSSDSWTIPHTGLTLTSARTGEEGHSRFLFSTGTVGEIDRTYGLIAAAPVVPQPFATPGFYRSFSDTPGFLVPPKWYLRLSPRVRQVLEIPLAGQTLLQLLLAGLTLLLYGWALLLLFRRLLGTYRYYQPRDIAPIRSWHQDNVAWFRVLLVLPVLPLTRLSDLFIDDQVNFTGDLLVVVTYMFFISYFLAASTFSFFLFEALGRTLAEWLVRLRGGGSELQLRRVSNLVMPVCRVLGGLVALVLIYRLLIVLGLPSTTVLAFSAVPGLAIGLGASKLLGNLFAGLSIQTDRPVRVGEFCRIGDNLGFVTRIGLRSMELETLDSRVTIPNAIADDETIVNFTRRQRNGGESTLQSLALELTVQQGFSPEQVNDLLQLVRRELTRMDVLQQPLVSLRQEGLEAFTLLCHGLVLLHDWPRYLAVRERLLLRLEELVEQVRRSQRQIGVSYDTSGAQLARIPGLIRTVVERDGELALQSCRLLAISDFSYDYTFRFVGSHSTFGAFEDGIDRLNRDLLACFAAEGIEIPYPTAVEIQRDS